MPIMAEPEQRKILSPDESGKNDFDPTWGNMLHVYGKDQNADRAYDAMVARQKTEDERTTIAIERHEASRLGVLQQFDKYVAEGKFREFISTLNFLRLKEKCKLEKQVAFGLGAAVGFFLALLLFR
jgi:putative heme degradation protein